jgi:hypothetical protein
MNERIDELAFQSGITQHSYSNPKHPDLDGFIVSQEKLEKFAKLIVEECAELIDNKEIITAAQTYDEVFVAKFDTKELCAKQIREHFGVDDD